MKVFWMILGPFHPDLPELCGLEGRTGRETYERRRAFCIWSKDFSKRIKHLLRQENGVHKPHHVTVAFVVLLLAIFEELVTA